MSIKFFNNHRIKFENLPEQFKCCLCEQILNKAYQAKCGCKMCMACMIDYTKNGPKFCPCNIFICNYIITGINDKENIFHDKATDKDISHIEMQCPFNTCPFSFQLKYLKHHIDSCQVREVFCEVCKIKIIFTGKYFECEVKIEFCELCEANLIFCECDVKKLQDSDIKKSYNGFIYPLVKSISKILDNYNFDFSDISSHLKCVICKNILINAKQTICGCKVCNKCIQEYLSNGPRHCPSNDEDCAGILLHIDKNINQDNATNKEIIDLIVKCPFKSCQYKNNLKSLAKHLEECEFREIICDQCNDKIIFSNKYDHDQLFCTMRNIFCSFCFTKMSFNDYVGKHFDIDSDIFCNNYMDICPNRCNLTEQVNLKQHLKFCSHLKQNCLFSYLNCKEDKMTTEDLMKHMNHEIIEHSSSLISKMKEFEETIERLQNQISIQKSINKELEEINKKNQEFQINSEKIIKELSNTMSNVISNIKKDCTNRNGNFIWKFSEFDTHLIEAERGDRISFTSDPFYTSEFGYKLCLRIYPAGDGIGKGTHLSVFFAIMKGEFDDLLTWPFKQKVTLSILDQEFGLKHHSETFKPDSRAICYQKPSDVYNVASGSPKFISSSMINNNSSYCRNNTIYFKISVDTNGITKP